MFLIVFSDDYDENSKVSGVSNLNINKLRTINQAFVIIAILKLQQKKCFE